MCSPAVSVLIPVHNVAPYAERALDSLLRQTFQDFEVVVVDDGSTDETLAIVHRYAETEPRIKIVQMARNSGIVDALNAGLEHCEGEYIARMDGDDVAYAHRLAVQVSFLREHPEVALVGCSILGIDVHDQPIASFGVPNVPVTPKAIADTLEYAPPCTHTWMARRSLYQALNGYRALSPAEDYDFLLRCVTSGFVIRNVAEPLMKVRMRPGNCADVCGLRQRKTHRYVVNLYRERRQNQEDTFSVEGRNQAIRSGKLEEQLHSLATRLVKQAFVSPNRVKQFSLLLLAASMSTWQAGYFFDRARQKLILRRGLTAAPESYSH